METGIKKNRISYITWLQFLGFVFVVFGHSMNDIDVSFVFKEAKAWVYTFHMPLFFFVSAYLFSYKGGFKRGYGQVFSKRAVRLLVPYLIWNTLFILPKLILVPDARDHVVFSLNYFTHMLLYPRDAILGHTWFLFALFEMFILAILFEKLRAKQSYWIPVLALLVVINCFGVTNRFLAVGDLMKNGVYFWCGLLAGGIEREKLVKFCKDKSLFLSVIILVFITTVLFFIFKEMTINTLVVGMAALFMFMLMGIFHEFKWGFIDFVSRNSFPMYIMHWPVMMIVRLVVYFKLGLPPVIAMILMFFGGILIPALAVVILRKINIPGIKQVIKLTFGM